MSGSSQEDTPKMAELQPSQTTIMLTPEMFEKMYLSPEKKVSGDLRRTFAVPSAL